MTHTRYLHNLVTHKCIIIVAIWSSPSTSELKSQFGQHQDKKLSRTGPLHFARVYAMSEVRASHLLVKHQGSRRPASWRDPDGAVITKRSKAAALDELEAYREQIESGAVTFADLAAKVSDCSSAKHGGDLGFFGPGKMQKAFEVRRNTPQRCSQHVVDSLSTNRLIWFFPRPKVPFSSRPSVPDHRSPHHFSPQDGAFALQVGEMSGVVDSDSGVHITIRTA